jgi:Tfp pilus assembly protein PilF
MNGDTLKAVPYLEKAIEKNPNNNPVNTFLSTYYRSKGDDARSRHYSKFITNNK